MNLKSVLSSLSVIVGLLIFLSGCMARKVVDSPEKQLQAEVRVSRGIPFLDVLGENGKRVVSVRLGLKTSEGEFDRRIKVEAQPDVELSKSGYRLVAGKSSSVSVCRHSAVFSLVNADGYRLQVEVHIDETGVAFRYRMPGKRSVQVLDDLTAFTFPEDARGYFQPISEVRRSNGDLIPSYESRYEIGVPITQTSTEHAG